MKRLFTSAFCLILAGLLTFGAVGTVGPPPPGGLLSVSGAQSSTGNDAGELPHLSPDIAMTVRFDHDNQVRAGVAVPAFITIDNKGQAVDGLLRVSVTPRRSDQASTYEMPVYIEQGVTADYTVPFRATDSTDSIKVHLLQRDQVVAEAAITGTYVQFTDRMLVGVFSNNQQGMNYWYAHTTSIQDSNYTSVRIKPVELEAADLPEEFYLMDRFALLVLNHFDLSYFNEAQVNTLVQWVQNGGHIIVDADAANRQAVESLSPLLELHVTGEQPELTEEEELIASANDPDYGMLQGLGQVSPQGKIIMGAARPLIMEYPVGKGKVIATTFALDQGISLEVLGIPDLFTRINGISGWDSTTTDLFPVYYNYSADSNMTSAVKSITWLDAPHLAWVVIILVIFIALAGPASYFILKKRDKRDWNWVVAPALSLIFCAIITGYGVVRHGTQPISSVITIVDQRNDSSPVQSFSLVGIAAPRQGTYQLGFEEDLFPYKPVDRNYYYSYYTYDDQDVPVGKPVVQFDMSGYPSVTFQQIRQWSMDTLYLQRNNVGPEGQLQARVWYVRDEMHYTVVNGTEVPLEDVTITSYAGWKRIEYMEPGEEVSGIVDPFDDGTYYSYSYLSPRFSRDLYGDPDDKTEDENRENYMKSRMATVLVEYLTDDYLYDEPVVWAWSKDLGALSITANGKPMRNDLNRTMIIGDAQLTYGDNELYIPFGQIAGYIVDVQDDYGMAYEGDPYAEIASGEVTFAFYLPQAVKEYDLDSFAVDGEDIYGEDFTAYLYNYRTSDWDEYQLDYYLTGSEVQDYIYDNGSVLLKIAHGNGDGDIDGDWLDPVYIYTLTIGVSGKEKADAGD